MVRVAAWAAGIMMATVGCNKLDVTDIGSDLIPQVDNVKTFDTLLDVNTVQGFFADSTRIANTDNMALGYISPSYDPQFGRTTGNIFVQFKPNFYPYYLGNARDTIQGYPNTGIDSLVVCLSYLGSYGDSAHPQRFEVREILSSAGFKDSTYTFSYRPTSGQMSDVLGWAEVIPEKLKDWVRFTNKRDSVRNQIRIRITDANFLTRFASFDSSASSSNNAFRTDSLWSVFFKGFAITVDSSTGGRSMLYTNLSDANTRLEVHYRKRPAVYNGGKIDSSFTILPFLPSTTITARYSPYANNIARTWFFVGAEIATAPSNAVYIQTGPGTFDTLSIPGLRNFPNSIVHRAELLMYQIPSTSSNDDKLTPPNQLYLDLVDSPAKQFYSPFPIDLNPESGYFGFPGASNINFTYYGGFLRYKLDGFGVRHAYYNMNITRHVQGVITRREPNKTLRLYAPFEIDYTKNIGFFARYRYLNNVAFGRVKLGSGTNPDTNYRMRLRIVYSKI
jgi:hypothetical protein